MPVADARPVLLPTSAAGESFAGYTYHLDGELVPVLTVDLDPGQYIYFEHHIMLWKHPEVQIGLMQMRGALKRMMAGMQIFVTMASGPGQIAVSRDGAGHIFGLHLAPGQAVEVREHQFLAATQGVEYTFQRVRGVASMLFGGSGFFIDRFQAADSPGILWLHGYGNVFEKTLAPGESIDIEPGGWLYKDPSVTMTTNLQRLSSGLFGGMSFITNRMTGPGRVGIQSMYLHMPTAD
ncbi:MAG TPA: AIM24 family protein [Stellaceae bacterium]|nr:AIM24 family protein [Stellaceae bacterium]